MLKEHNCLILTFSKAETLHHAHIFCILISDEHTFKFFWLLCSQVAGTPPPDTHKDRDTQTNAHTQTDTHRQEFSIVAFNLDLSNCFKILNAETWLISYFIGLYRPRPTNPHNNCHNCQNKENILPTFKQ